MECGLPRVSVVIPCRDEALSIEACIRSVIAGIYPKDRLEVLVVDGMSGDGTREIVEAYTRRHGFIRLLDNPKKITPVALNIGITNATGGIIVVLGAHATCSPEYILKCVKAIEEYDADCVGGLVMTLPVNDTSVAQAIAIALSHPFGIGNSYFRIGASDPRWVDTVAFGCYKKEVFNRIGGFDEELARNQDDELNLRLIKRGGRILLVPGIVSYYRARGSLRKLWRMFYQYGYFKPLVARKVGGIVTGRQVVPAAFILSLFATGMVAPWSPIMGAIFAMMLFAYAAAALGSSTAVAFRHGVRCGLVLCIVFPVMHVSYGLGFLKGALDFLVIERKRSKDLAGIPISR
jgi:glycosyltransferase involved in cell wall biosynthesis